LTKHKHKV